jgi:hypothetical protein
MRILATLEGETEGATRKTSGIFSLHKSLYAGLAVTLILALAYLAWQSLTASKLAPPAVTVASTVPDLPAAQTASALPTDTLDPAPAAIVETQETAAQNAPAPEVAQPSKPGHPPLQIFESTTPTEETPADVAPPAPVPVSPKKATVTTKTTQSRPAPAHSREVRAPASGARVKNSPTSPEAVPNVKPRDTDVDLLTALMTHSRQTTPAAPASAPTHSPVSPTASANNAMSGQATALRQVVVQSPVASTADLVKQCGALGWLEGWLCKRRICDSLWGKDPACSTANAMTSTQ